MRTLYTLGAGGATKSISLTDAQLWKDALNWDIGTDEQISAAAAYSAVGWVTRCVHVRSTALMTLPWALTSENSGDEIANSEDTSAATFDWLDELPELLYLSEAALCIYAAAYWHKQRTRRTITGVRWFQPDSMEPLWTPAGLSGFRRVVNGMMIPALPVEDVVYVRMPNPLHETEHATSPVQTALMDAQVIHNSNQFAAMFFKRGAIKATILTVDGNPLPQEKERLKTWWARAFSGLTNAFNTEVVSAAVHPVIVGEGISELNNTELTTEKREAIATALGIPHSLVMSNAANYATADADRLNFYDTTIIPESTWIAKQLNRQLFGPLGYRLQFKPKQLPIYQEDEEQRAQAFSAYVAAGMRPSIAAQMLGMTLPEGVEYGDLDETFDKPAPTPVIVQPPQNVQDKPAEDAPEDEPATDEDEREDGAQKSAEIAKFRKWLKRRPNADIHKFASAILTHDELHAIADDVRGEVAPVESFFTLPAGNITLEWWRSAKALILQLNPDDDEAEQRLRMELEQRTARELRRALRDMMQTLYPEGWDTDNPQLEQSRIHDAFLRDQKLRDTISRAVQDGADLGVNMAIDTLENIGIAFDYTLVHETARAWALQYTDDLLNQLGTTSGRLVGQSVGRWFENGEPLSSLINDLTPAFGQRRAKLISSTEVTRAAVRGTLESYRATNIIKQVQIRVARGEKVCPICGKLDGVIVPMETGHTELGFPPFHPACRCWVVGVAE